MTNCHHPFIRIESGLWTCTNCGCHVDKVLFDMIMLPEFLKAMTDDELRQWMRMDKYGNDNPDEGALVYLHSIISSDPELQREEGVLLEVLRGLRCPVN